MIDIAELTRGLAGAWRLMKFDATGLFHFNASAEGARRSLQAIFFAAPVQMILIALSNSAAADRPFGWREGIIESLIFFIDWTVPLVGVSLLAQRQGWTQRLNLFIGAYNYSYLLLHWLFLLVVVFSAFLPGGLNGAVVPIALMASIAYQSLVARAALKLAPLETALFGLALFFLSYLIETLRASLLSAAVLPG